MADDRPYHPSSQGSKKLRYTTLQREGVIECECKREKEKEVVGGR